MSKLDYNLFTSFLTNEKLYNIYGNANFHALYNFIKYINIYL